MISICLKAFIKPGTGIPEAIVKKAYYLLKVSLLPAG